MQAIILAAGMGKRLKELTRNNTKCMVKVNGQTLIERMLNQLDKKRLSRIIIVVGYEGEKLIDYISTLNVNTPIIFENNPIYDKTNNIYSLSLAKEYLCEEDTLLFESDLIFEESVIDAIIEDKRDTLALVDKYASWMDGTCVKISSDDGIEEFISSKRFKFDEINDYYKTVNIYKFSKEFSKTHYVPFLEAYTKALGNNEYYEQVLKVVSTLDDPVIKAKRLNGQLWYEIDDVQDLDIATSMFEPNYDEKVALIQKRYGGYWRYPQLIDFCYLVNPYFPPKKLVDEIKSNFEVLLTQYPSGMGVNSLLASKNFDVHQQNIVIGNGAAELIKALMSVFTGKIGFVRPTFEEYPNRYDKQNSIYFVPNNSDFSYNENDLIEYFSDTDLEALVVINPDNPTGNYIDKQGVLKLIDWTKKKRVKLVIDESFVDFADQLDSTLIIQELLEKDDHLYVIKSISKSYGVPGLRLGVLASGDKQTIAKIKKEVSIWNINSFAEFYLQIIEKYKKDYQKALVEFRKERKRYVSKLIEISSLRVVPSQANYVMVEIINGLSAKQLTKQLLVKYNLFIKDLTSKIGVDRQFIRLAIRNSEDNDKLVNALKEILS